MSGSRNRQPSWSSEVLVTVQTDAINSDLIRASALDIKPTKQILAKESLPQEPESNKRPGAREEWGMPRLDSTARMHSLNNNVQMQRIGKTLLAASIAGIFHFTPQHAKAQEFTFHAFGDAGWAETHVGKPKYKQGYLKAYKKFDQKNNS